MQKVIEYAKKSKIRLHVEQDIKGKYFVYVDGINYPKIAEILKKRKIENIKFIITDWKIEYLQEPKIIQLGYEKIIKTRFFNKNLNYIRYKNIAYVDMRKEKKDDFQDELEAVNNLSIDCEQLPEHVNVYDGKFIYYKRRNSQSPTTKVCGLGK